MRQNHPETSLIPSHITPKHIPKLFGGVIFHPKSPKNGQVPKLLRLLGTYRPYKTAKTATRPSCVTPKARLWGSLRAIKCLDASYSVPRHHTITMGSYLGVPRAPWVRQNPTCKIFTVFQPNLPCKTTKTPYGTILCDSKTHLRGSLRATKCLEASYSVPRHHTITMGPYLGVPRAPWVRQNPTC